MMKSRSLRQFASCASVAALLALMARASPAQDASIASARIVAIGDVHGDYDQFAGLLRAAGLMDAKEKWIGGRARLVQTGDVLDRGPASRKTMDLLMKLEKQAASAGGRVHALIGNHEAMNVYGDLRYVVPEDYAAFRTRGSADVRDAFYARYVESLKAAPPPEGLPVFDEAFRALFDERYPLGFAEHRFAFGPNGPYGKWIRRHDAVVKIDDTLFLHGGIGPKYVAYTVQQLNDGIRTEIEELGRIGIPLTLEDRMATDPEGPLWYRELVTGDEVQLASHVDRVLEAYGVKRVVVGHSINEGAIMPRFGGRVVSIDVALSKVYGGPPACLIIENGKTYALHRGQQVELPAASGAELLPYLKRVAALDPAPSPLQKRIAELEAVPVPAVRATPPNSATRYTRLRARPFARSSRRTASRFHPAGPSGT